MSLTDIQGLITAEIGDVLRHLAAQVPADQAIVEIGVFKGRSASYLGVGARAGAGAHVYAIDPWDLPGERYPYHWLEERPSRHAFTKPETREAAEAAIAALDLAGQVTLVRGFSAEEGQRWQDGLRCRRAPERCDEPYLIGLLHVDGDHRADAVRADWAAWSPHLAPGAIIAWDDHVRTCPDVPLVVAELVRAKLVSPPRMATRRLALTRSLLP